MLDIDKIVKGIRNDTRRRVKVWSTPKRVALVALANALETDMREKGFDATASTCSPVDVNVTLRKDQSLVALKPFLKQVARTRDYLPAEYSPQPEYSIVTWTFRPRNTETHEAIRFYVSLGTSVTCRRIGTGIMVEEYKVVCDDLPSIEL